MADISKITTLDGTTYDLKDAIARASVASFNTLKYAYHLGECASYTAAGAAIKALLATIDNVSTILVEFSTGSEATSYWSANTVFSGYATRIVSGYYEGMFVDSLGEIITISTYNDGTDWYYYSSKRNNDLLNTKVSTDGSIGSIYGSPSQDIDNFYTGVILCSELVPKTPSAEWWLIISGGTIGTRVQVAYSLFNNHPPKMRYQATSQSGAFWSAWENIKGGSSGVVLQNVSIPTSSWSIDTDHTLTDYPYYAAIPVTGMTADMVPEVVFGVNDASSGNYASVCQSDAGYVYIYAMSIPESAITILTVTGR